MRKSCLSFIISVALIFQATASLAGQLSASLVQYRTKTQEALFHETNEYARQYLLSCLLASEYLNGIEAGDAGWNEAFDKLVKRHIEADGYLIDGSSNAPGVRIEKTAYDTYLEPYRGDEYIRLIALQNQLLERKYFKTETSKEANYLEGLINSRWSRTRAEQGDPKVILAKDRLGVSPWEAIFRLEPALVFDDGAQVAIIGSAGLSYAFFPEIKRNIPETFNETFGSKWIKKAGGRLGVGVNQIDSTPHLIVGPGVQIRAVGLWGLYEPADKTYMLGISVSDLSILKKVMPWFD